MQILFSSYRFSLVFLLLIFSITKSAVSQIALLDDVALTDQQRDQQLLKNNFKQLSFLLRTAQDYRMQQNIPYRKIWKELN